MLINRRNALMAGKRLPYDAEVEYIDAPKGSYIDTGFKPNQDTHVMMDVTVQGINENWFGVHEDSSKIDDANYYSGTNKYVMCNDGSVRDGSKVGGIFSGYGANGLTSTVSWPAIGSGKTDHTHPDLGFGRYTVDFDKRHATIKTHDGTGTAYDVTRAANTFQMQYNMYLFAVNVAGTASTRTTQGTLRCHACRIWDNGVLVRDLISVRKGMVGAMYDRVSGKLFRNAGTGAFLYGI